MPRLSQPEVSQPGAIGAIADVECASSDTETLHDACARIEAKLDEVVAFVRRGRPPSASAELAAAGAPRRSSASRPSVRSQGIYGDMNLNASIASTPLHASASSGIFVASTLPLGWPHALEMREGWRRGAARATKVEAAGDEIGMSRTRTNDLMQEECDAGLLTPPQYAWCTIDPNSRFNMFWGLLSLAVLLYDVTLLPYLLAWDVPIVGWLEVSGWTTAAYWCIDVVLAFHTGFFEGGELKMNPRSIRIRYATTWFVPDAAVIVSDWVSLALVNVAGDSSGRGVKMLRFAKLGRMLRIVGMMRMLRVVRILEDFAQRHLTDGYRLTFNMASLFSCIMWVAHILSCMWFAVGLSGPSDTGARWVDQQSVLVSEVSPLGEVTFRRVPYLETGHVYQYMVAFHWAAGQIALGAFDGMPTNSLERLVFVLAMMVGFLFGSTLVSTLSAAMMDYQMMHKDRRDKLRTLRQYLRENEVDQRVALPVQKMVEQRLMQHEALSESEVPALQLLSTALRVQLRFEIQRAALSTHPMLSLWIRLDTPWMQATCAKCVSFVLRMPRDDIFVAGEQAAGAYTVVHGEIAYTQRPENSPVDEEEFSRHSVGEWLCEAALWTHWQHVGSAEAVCQSTLLLIDPAVLGSCMKMGVVQDIAGQYCDQFHKRAVSAGPPHTPWPNDVHVPFTDYSDLVLGMSPTAQQAIGEDAVDQLLSKGASMTRGSALEKLRREVQTSKSIVVVTGTGDIVRVVSLVVLRCVRQDGMMLAQIGKLEGSEVTGSCQLPGLKCEREELVSETLDRLMESRLQRLNGLVELRSAKREVTEKESKEYGVQTRYTRTVCQATLLDDAAAPSGGAVMRAEPRLPHTPSSPHVGRIKSIRKAPNNEMMTATQSANTMSPALRTYLAKVQDEVFTMPGANGTPNIFAWLTPADFDYFSSPAGDSMLKTVQRWIDIEEGGQEHSSSEEGHHDFVVPEKAGSATIIPIETCPQAPHVTMQAIPSGRDTVEAF
mmetsp:Transcript_74659/g.228446  ORF Transcript_74659/g.228446 Transcript_74659/m.228446 type:complete len:998 (-) Transcript_74659:114-3107(-)